MVLTKLVGFMFLASTCLLATETTTDQTSIKDQPPVSRAVDQSPQWFSQDEEGYRILFRSEFKGLPITLESTHPGNQEEHNKAFEKILSEADTMFYLNGERLEGKQLEERARAQTNLHLRTFQEGLPRCVVKVEDDYVGYVRVGNTDSKRLKELGKQFGFDVANEGVGEAALMLEKDYASQGLGRFIVQLFKEEIMPFYVGNENFKFTGAPLAYLFVTHSPEQEATKRLAERAGYLIAAQGETTTEKGTPKRFVLLNLKQSITRESKDSHEGD